MIKRSIIIGGDIVPTKSNYDLFSQGDVLSLVGDEINALLSSYDFRIYNLETPLCNTEKPTKKWGPNLAAPTSTIKGIKLLNPSLLVTGNNHIMDQGIQGYLSTIETLKNNKINSVGSGENLAQAVIPYIYEKDGVKVGIYSCAEHEFSIATESNSGANPFDVLESLDHIVNLKSVCDYVIVIYHGGLQHYSYPTPLLQKVCRKMAGKGADLIICQQSHCIGSYEEYCGSTIVYGQGNFVFDYSTNELEKTSLLIGVNFEKGMQIEFIPICKMQNCVRMAKGKAAEEILSAFYERSKCTQNEGFIERQYQKFAQDNYSLYISPFSGFGKWLSRIDYYFLKGRLAKNKYNKKQLLGMQNSIECEANRELVLACIKGAINSGK